MLSLPLKFPVLFSLGSFFPSCFPFAYRELREGRKNTKRWTETAASSSSATTKASTNANSRLFSPSRLFFTSFSGFLLHFVLSILFIFLFSSFWFWGPVFNLVGQVFSFLFFLGSPCFTLLSGSPLIFSCLHLCFCWFFYSRMLIYMSRWYRN